ncbi:preprotein translocase subunit SecA [Clostridium tagluense]|uniref:preprotein translocase subunit SecA n=1 Tax=Clostridium tagluense TaxID=360422 RepID=UPI001C6E0DE0|nr:DEAD/DEAH box helicase [Clostridium tagluense]MBW9156521.1 accessory Sec system translocase SecA2 [Clostridium tagluense]WLC64080.1 accessory Sec system translocase SecA2 [Clostridium tagluense]
MSINIRRDFYNLVKKSEYGSYKKIVDQINRLKFDSLDNIGFLNKSHELKGKILDDTSIDGIIIEAFALAKEAVKRVLGLTPYDEQLIAGIAIHKGKLIEMQTGEGKTLAAVFPAFLNALAGRGCHILTFNDYLARRDATWMGPVYEMLGLTVGFVQETMERHEKQRAYAFDITYVTAKVAGFDYLIDSLSYKKSEIMLRPFNFAIVDEADSILIDEARIPLVIATGGDPADNTLSLTMEALRKLEPEVDYAKDEVKRNAFLTPAGLLRAEAMLCCENLYAEENFKLLSEVHNIIHVIALLKKDIDYIVKDGKIEMVDEFTGRVAVNRRWPDGIQAALEAKECLRPKSKGRIMNQITLQSFILLYKKIAGMTGTAMDSLNEISEMYDMEVLVIPPHLPCKRIDYPDVIFTHKKAKYKALSLEIKRIHDTGQPILIGTCSVSESEYLAEELNKLGVKHNILNAKNDELEAHIIEQAATLYAVTVSTNMAGRGADIKLGGLDGTNRDKIASLGGLYVIGTNRQESIRIDKQLKGRTGRQGDVGMSKFFISLEDDLIKRYGIHEIIPVAIRPKMQEEPLLNPRIASKIEHVQRIIQGQDSDLRRALWQYSTFIENQRLEVYQRRMEILYDTLPFNILRLENPQLFTKLINFFSECTVNELEKQVALYNIDEVWVDYLAHVAYLQDGVKLSILQRKNPLQEFQLETASVFQNLQQEIQKRILQDFESLDLSNQGLISLKGRIKPPSSTWTYLVNDNSLIDPLSSLFIRNAIASIGILTALPIRFGTWIYDKIF